MNGLYDQPDSPAVCYFDLYTQFQNTDISVWIEEARWAGGPVLGLDEARRTHEWLETGHTRGKIVLQVIA